MGDEKRGRNIGWETLRVPERKLEDNIKIYIKNDWINLAQGRDWRRAPVNTVPLDFTNDGEFLD